MSTVKKHKKTLMIAGGVLAALYVMKQAKVAASPKTM